MLKIILKIVNIYDFKFSCCRYSAEIRTFEFFWKAAAFFRSSNLKVFSPLAVFVLRLFNMLLLSHSVLLCMRFVK